FAAVQSVLIPFDRLKLACAEDLLESGGSLEIGGDLVWLQTKASTFSSKQRRAQRGKNLRPWRRLARQLPNLSQLAKRAGDLKGICLLCSCVPGCGIRGSHRIVQGDVRFELRSYPPHIVQIRRFQRRRHRVQNRTCKRFRGRELVDRNPFAV